MYDTSGMLTGPNTVQTPAANGNIALGSPAASMVIVNPAAAVTGITMDAGTIEGQLVWVINQSANTLTFAAVGTSHVQDGTGDIIPANAARLFIYSIVVGSWSRAA